MVPDLLGCAARDSLSVNDLWLVNFLGRAFGALASERRMSESAPGVRCRPAPASSERPGLGASV